jgi:hypothetical protein
MDQEVRSTPEEAERPGGVGEGARSKAHAGLAYARLPSVRIGAAIALAVGAGLLVWALVTGDDEPEGNARSARAVSAGDLAALPASVGHPVYWAGPRRRFTYELTRTKDDRIFIRYLPAGVAVGTDEPNYLAVGTYPVKNGIASVRAIAKRLGTSPLSTSGGGVAVQDKDHPSSIYLAYPGSAYQVEVFHPSPAVAARAVLSGGIVRLGSVTGPSQTSAASPKVVTVSSLRAFAASVKHPVYWAGPIPARRIELTQTSDGRIYVRYLPRRARVGDRLPHLTVGTYPARNALAAVEAIGKRPGAQRFSVDNGLAVVDPAHPTSIYLAVRGSKYQIEVFDPSPAKARQFVTSRRITPVR